MSAIDGLPKLSDVIRKHGLAAKKTLGQNFLLDLNITMKIARTAGRMEGATVIEVGPGPGGLTRALLAADAGRVIAIERDERCLPALSEIAEAYPGRLEVLHGDALATDFSKLSDKPAKIVANLPYNIATPLLTGWLTTAPWPPYFESMTLMFQREVAQRITAQQGDKHYGRLGVLAGWRTDAQISFDLAPEAFTPPPKVTSSVVQFTPRATPLACDVKSLETVTQAAFGQRRKMLRQSLKSIGGAKLLEQTGIVPTKRAEELTVEEFVGLANALKEPA